MEDVIQKLEEKRGYYQEQLRAIEDQLNRLDQALAALRGDDSPIDSLQPEKTSRPGMTTKTPWP
jgi:prefoldin subunit 5